ncbi:MAG: PBP1A family penicillin-binding protein [Syntrophobacterales bacterium]|jgi:penicillin-binding protein 1A|nr:PBP1A family penicillin-binding protein [Syntrophobacterales bacterium]
MKFFKAPSPDRLEKYHQRRRWARRLSWALYGLVFTAMLGAAGTGVFIYYHFLRDLPDFTSVKEFRPSVITQVFARDGRPIGEFYSERRIEVPYSRLPRHLVLAFVAAEDARFFEHPGVDVSGIVRAFFRNLEAGEVVQGGSTITQQVVKRILLTSEKSFARKIREAVLAYRIDHYMTKEEILDVYLNHIFLGHGAYGVEAAAQEYFSKHVEDLNLAEASILAGIPKAPSRYDPYLNPQRAKERQAYVLRRMAEVGFISRAEEEAALRQPITLKPYRPQWIKECGYFTEQVRSQLEDRFGKESVYNMGLKVYTTADVHLHKVAHEAIMEGVDGLIQRNGYRGPLKHVHGKEMSAYYARQVKYYRRYPPRKGVAVTALVVGPPDRRQRGGAVYFRLGEQWGVLSDPSGSKSRASMPASSLRPGDVVMVRLVSRERQGKWNGELIAAPMVQAAVVSMEIKTGKVRVLMGGKDFGDSTFNRATQARRQPGSAFKPILYAAAVEKGYGPDSTLLDSPLSLPGGKHGQLWSPQNYDHRFYGPIPLAYALAHSRNVPAVRLMMAIGVPATVNMAKTLGIASPIFPNYASALGASDVTLMELTRAYSSFPNGGKLIEPILINRIEDRDGRVLVENRPTGQQVISPQTANTMTHLLMGVVERGTATRVQALGRPMGGKTGTTNKTRDAWFIGFTPSLITGTWVGMDDEHSLGPKETGSQAAAPIFMAYMKEALKGTPVEQFGDISGTVLAKQGSEEAVPKGPNDDEEAAQPEETFYPEEQGLRERTPTPQASSQQFFKNDLDE